MEKKTMIALAVAVVAVVAAVAVIVAGMGPTDKETEATGFNVEVNVLEGDSYVAYRANGADIRSILEDAFGDDISVANNGNVQSFKGKANDADHSWMVFRYRAPTGWEPATKSNLVEGASLALEYSEKTTQSGKVTYTVPDLEVEREVYFFIQIPSFSSIQKQIDDGDFKEKENEENGKTLADCFGGLRQWLDLAGLDTKTVEEGFWIKGSGTNMNEALVDALHSCLYSGMALTVDCEGNKIVYKLDGEVIHSHGIKPDMYGWFLEFMDWSDQGLKNGDWTYWSQYSYNPDAATLDDGRQWSYNQWALGLYDMDVRHYMALVLQTTQKEGVERALPAPSTIPEDLLR